MVNESTVRSVAKGIARDARKTKDLTDAEAECLRDLLASDEAFAFLVTAQQSAVMFDNGGFDVDDETVELAIDAAGQLGDALDRVVDDHLEDARAIEGLRQTVDAIVGIEAYHLFKVGIESIEDLHEASQSELADAKLIGPAKAATIKAEVGEAGACGGTVATDGGFDLPTYGTCSCGGTHVLDPETIPEDEPDVANGMVEFPCDSENCDWAASMSPPAFELAVEKSDHSLDELREQVATSEVAA
jgi:hypothetical protein